MPTFSGRVIRLDANAMMRHADGLALATITSVEVERTACSRTTIVHLKATKIIRGHVELGKTYVFTYTTYPNPSGKSAEPGKCRRVHYYAPPRASPGKRAVIAIIKDGAVVGTVDP